MDEREDGLLPVGGSVPASNITAHYSSDFKCRTCSGRSNLFYTYKASQSFGVKPSHDRRTLLMKVPESHFKIAGHTKSLQESAACDWSGSAIVPPPWIVSLQESAACNWSGMQCQRASTLDGISDHPGVVFLMKRTSLAAWGVVTISGGRVAPVLCELGEYRLFFKATATQKMLLPLLRGTYSARGRHYNL